MTNTIFLKCALSLGLLAGLSGCGGATASSEPAAPPTQLTVSGSGSATALLETLAESDGLGNVELEVLEGAGTSGGMAAVAAGEIDVAAISRAPEPDEVVPGVSVHLFAADGIAFVGQDGGVASLTRKQLLLVFAGKVTNWRELGGANLPIVLLIRDESESVTQQLRSALFGASYRFAATATVLESTGDMNEALERTEGALGFTSNGSLVNSGSQVTRLGVGGVRPTVAAIQSLRYPFTRQLGVAFRPTPAVEAFVAHLQSAKVQARLQKLGYAAIG
jgi:phosphate transport system substrate-binding protein